MTNERYKACQMKKFTLLTTDNVRFEIKQKWDLTAPEVIIRNSYCYPYINYFINSIYNPFSFSLKDVSLNGILSLIIKKDKQIITYDIENVQLDFQGNGNNIKVASIDVTVNELTDKVKVKINLERSRSFTEKIFGKYRKD